MMTSALRRLTEYDDTKTAAWPTLRELSGGEKVAAGPGSSQPTLAFSPLFSGTSLTGNITALGNKALGAAGAANNCLGRNVGLAVPSFRELKAAPAVVGSTVGNTFSDYRPRGWNPAKWVGGSQRAYALDKKIDEINARRTDGFVNRGSDYVRNEKRFNVSGITPAQRRVVVDTFDAAHKAGDKGTPPKVRPPGIIHRLGELVKGPNAGGYLPATNTIRLRPDNGGWSPEYLIGHEMGHWSEAQKPSPPSGLYRFSRFFGHPFSRAAYNSAEFNADAGAYRYNELRHPESKMPERKAVLKAISGGRTLEQLVDEVKTSQSPKK